MMLYNIKNIKGNNKLKIGELKTLKPFVDIIIYIQLNF